MSSSRSSPRSPAYRRTNAAGPITAPSTPVASLPRDDRILPPEAKQIPMQSDDPSACRSRSDQSSLDRSNTVGSRGSVDGSPEPSRRPIARELSEELLSPLVDLPGQLASWKVGEEQKGSGCPELLPHE
jgi:hypothetical protein